MSTTASARRSQLNPAKLGLGRHLGLGSYWLGTYFLVTPVYTILLQVQVAETVGKSGQALGVGFATFAGGVLALLVPPVVGHYSDNLRSRWGRRKPVLVAGTAGSVLAMAVMWQAQNYPAVFAGFVLAVTFVNVAGAAYVACIPDTVHGGETGRASGVLGFFVQLGSVLSLVTLLIASRSGHLRATYGVIIAVLVLTLIPTLWALGRSEGPRAEPDLEVLGSLDRLRRFLSPLWTGDFGWAVFTRLLYMSAFYTVLPFLLYSFRDLQRVPRPDQFTATFELIVTAVAVPVALVCGWLSDRSGRKRFVYAAGAIAALVLLVFGLGPVLPASVVLGMGVVYGLGYGTYVAVDWALALDTLPNPERPAKDLGLFHVADALPRVLMPLFASLVLASFNQLAPNAGYRAMFLLAVLLYGAGTLFVSRIRSVR